MDTDKLKLYEFILDHYSLSELKDLCFYLSVVYDDLDGAARKDKARELVEYMARRRLDDLRAVLSQQRPEQYGEAFAAPVVETFRRNVSPANTTRPTRRVHEKTGIEHIYIPAGPFLYGSADGDEMALSDEKPQRSVDLPAYWIGRAPVTTAQFARFVKATGYRTHAERDGYSWGWPGNNWHRIKGANWRYPRGLGSSIEGKVDHPVLQINWNDARMFCDWAGLALPTEEQWEKAARGTDGRIWPWGDELPTIEHCNINNNVGDTTPIGQYSPKGDSPYGCVDMAGNVWEWVGSWYLEDSRLAWRGGAWNDNEQHASTVYRYINQAHYRHSAVGFRVVELLSDPGF